MSLNTLKLALRNIRTNKLVYGVSVLAIGLGALSASMLGTYLYFEMSTDRFHKNLDQIYMLAVKQSPQSKWEGLSSQFFNYGQNNSEAPIGLLAQTRTVSRYKEGELTMKIDSVALTPVTLVADSSFFNVFDFKVLTGSMEEIKSGESGVLLTKHYAMKLLGTTDVIGKSLEISGQGNMKTLIKGILDDLPPNSSIQFDALVICRETMTAFSRMGVEYLVLDDSFDKQAYLKALNAKMQKHEQFIGGKSGLIPLKSLYFNGMRFDSGAVSRQGNKQDLYVIVMVLLVLLVVTGLNVRNLQHLMARSMLKMTGVFRLLGATSREITHIHLVDSCTMALLSWVLSVLLFVLSKPLLTRITGLDLSAMTVSILGGSLLVVLLLLGLTGSLSRIELIRKPLLLALKGDRMKKLNTLNRKASLTFQFSLTIVLIFSSIVVFRQWSFMTKADLGWQYQEVVRTRFLAEINKSIQDPSSFENRIVKIKNDVQYLENELHTNPSVQSFSQGESPFQKPYEMPWAVKGSGMDFTTIPGLSVSPSTLRTLGFRLLEGRFVDKNRAQEVLINETAKKQWHIQSIDSCRLTNPYWSRDEGFQVVGVVRDFNYERLALPVKPLIMMCMYDPASEYLIRLTKGREQEGLAFLQKLHERVNPDEPFVYSFLADEAKALYAKEKNLGLMFGVLTIVTLLIALTGLFALTYYDCQRRIKEIGIRKTNGATVFQTVWLLNRELMVYLGLAFVFASSVGYVLMQRWLEQFAKHISLSWWIFALAGLIAFVVALLTVSGLSWRAATKNPVESLRYE